MTCLVGASLRPSLRPIYHRQHQTSPATSALPRRWVPAQRGEVRRQMQCVRAMSDGEPEGASVAEKNANSASRKDADWLELLPDATSALYCCSLPGIEAWLRSLGFQQLPTRPEEWRLEKDTWNAELSMDVTEFCVRYTSLDKQGGASPGKVTVERKFSYALSRQDLENAILAGP